MANILKGKVEPKKLVTDPVMINMARRMGLSVAKGDITFECDYDVSHRMFSNRDYHPFAKLYGVNKGDHQGAALQVISGLPMTRQTDGAKCLAKLKKIADKYKADVNMFDLTIDRGVIHAVPLNDQPGGKVTTGDYVEWNPVLKLDGNIVNPVSGPVLLSVDPVNLDYKHNTLQWNYGICFRRIRIIEGRIIEWWVFFSNPGGEVRIEHNHKGKASFRIGGPGIDVIDGDIEVVAKRTFDAVRYPFGIRASAPFYPTDGSYEDGYVQQYYAQGSGDTWSALRDAATGTNALASSTEMTFVRLESDNSSPDYVGFVRSSFAFLTSSLPDGCTKISGSLSLFSRLTGLNEWTGVDPKINLYSSDPANLNNIVVGDYDAFGTTKFSSADKDETHFSGDEVEVSFPLNQAGLDNISLTAASVFGARVTQDASDSEPTWESSRDFKCSCYCCESGGALKPKLIVEYISSTWCKEGVRVLADAVVKTAATPEDLEIFLFSDNEIVTFATVNADLTEITTNGGEKQTLTKANWDAATNADPVVSRYNGATGVSWNITGALTIYGYAIRGVTSLKIYGGENWGMHTVANGYTVEIKPFELKFDIV